MKRQFIVAVPLVAALVTSVFFQGFEVAVFCAVQIALLIGVVISAWRIPEEGLRIPVGFLPAVLTLLWIWNAVALIWSPVLYSSVFDFFWLGTLPLVFWAHLIDPDRERQWRIVTNAALAVGLTLALHACYQRFGLGLRASSVFLNTNSFAALMSLIALPLVARILDQKSVPAGDWRLPLYSGCFFLMILALALTKGRAATLLFFAAIALIFVAVRRDLAWRRVSIPAGLTALAFALAAADLGKEFSTQFSELQEPLRVRSLGVRFLIWESTWRMIEDAPWWGIGPGLFPLEYPSYRSPADDSAGFLVHNEYLQMLLEGGAPGLILLGAVVVGSGVMGARLLLGSRLNSAARHEVAGLTVSVGACSVHSLVDFNFHILPILILLGIMMVRLMTHAESAGVARTFALRFPAALDPRAVRLIFSLLLLFPLLYFVSISLAVVETDRAQVHARAGNLDEADRAFARAYRLYPTADNALVDHADLYRHVLAVLPSDRTEEQLEIFRRGSEMLDKAVALNPLRPLTYLVRGRLYEARGRHDSDGEWLRKAEDAYRHALGLNPRYVPAREALARRLLATGRRAEARELVESGLKQYIAPYVPVVPYLSLAARLRAEAGDMKGEAELRTRIGEILSAAGWARVVPPAERGPLDPGLVARPAISR